LRAVEQPGPERGDPIEAVLGGVGPAAGVASRPVPVEQHLHGLVEIAR
jgi:hypothetical protein